MSLESPTQQMVDMVNEAVAISRPAADFRPCPACPSIRAMEAALYIVEQMNRMLSAAVPFAPRIKDISPGYLAVVMGRTMDFESAHSLEEMREIARLTADRAVAKPNQGP